MEAKSIFLGLLLLAASVFALPVVSFDAPTPESGALLGSVPVINASATSSAGVDSVSLYWNGKLLKSCAGSQCLFDPSVDDATNATVSSSYDVNYVLIKAVASDSEGSSEVQRTIKIDVKPPVVVIKEPTTSQVSGTTTIKVYGEEKVSGLQRFEVSAGSYSDSNTGPFYYGNGEVTFSWDTTQEADGTYTITARVVDGVGNVGTATFDVVVNNSFPTIVFEPPTPANESNLSGSVLINLSASGNDVDSVVLHISGLSPVVLSAPYEYVWDTTAISDGYYEVYATANDTNGDLATTETLTYVVNNTGSASTVTVNFVEPTPGVNGSPTTNLSGLIVANATATVMGANLSELRVWIEDSSNSPVEFNSSNSGNTVLYWDSSSSPDGYYTIYARASADDGNNTTISQLIHVNNSFSPVEINISFIGSTPADGGSVQGDFTVEVEANSTASLDNITLFVDGVAYNNSCKSSPCNINVDTSAYAPGSAISFYATAYSGGTSNSTETRTVTYNPPSVNVSIDSPADGATVNGTVEINVSAQASNGLDSIVLFIDGSEVNSSTSSPLVFSWDTTQVANGPHTITAQANDTLGNYATNQTISVVVDNANPGVNLSISFVPPTPANGTVIDPTNTSTIINVSVVTNLTVDTITLYRDGSTVASDSASYLEYDWNVSQFGNGSYEFYATVNTTSGETASTPLLTLVVGQQNNNGGGNNDGGSSGGGGGGSSKKKEKDKPLSISYKFVCPGDTLEITVESDGSAVSGALVSIEKAGAGFAYVDLTDGDGVATFKIREAAEYSVNATKDGYEVAERTARITELCQEEEETSANETVETPEENETAELSVEGANETSPLEEVSVEEVNETSNETGELSPTTEPETKPLAEEQEQKGIIESLTENPVLAFFGIIAIPFLLIAISRVVVAVLKRL